MRILPVIDLLGGQVVRGVAGRRDLYRPIESRLCQGSSPADVARALVDRFGSSQAYVADLDAIAGSPPAWECYRRIADRGLSLWVDAGLRNASQARELGQFGSGSGPLAGVVAGLETLSGWEVLLAILDVVGEDRLVFSLDLKQGEPLTRATDFLGLRADEIAAEAICRGIRRIIVLDLARVGVGQGVGTENVCRAIHGLAPDVELIAGGGVRGLEDLELLRRAGCDGALVASALHDGRLTASSVRAFQETP